MERLRFPFPRLPRLLAAAVIVECCARLCPGLGTGTGSAIPCARPGERCRTGLERGAGTGPAPTPEAVGQPRTGAELPPFPGTPNGTAEPPSPPGSPQAGGEGTGPTAWGGTATQHLGLLLAAGSEGPSPPPALGSPPGTDPAGNVTAGGATTPQGTPSHSPSSATVPGSAGGQGGTPSTPPGWSPTGTGLALRQGGSHSPSPPEPWAGEGPGATVSRGDSSTGTHLSVSLATDSPVPGMMGTSPFVGGLPGLPSPAGTEQGTRLGLPGEGRGSDSHPGHRTDIAWQGPRSAPRPSSPSLGTGGRGDPPASTAQPATATGPTSLPAAGKGLGLPVPTATAGTPGVTSPSPGGALGPTPGLLGPPDPEGAPEHSHVPLDQTWQPPTSAAPGSTAVAQSGGAHASPGPPHAPTAPQPAPTSAVPTSPTPRPSPGTSWGVPGLSPTLGTPLTGPSPRHQRPHTGVGDGPAESPQILGGTPVGVGDARPWAATTPPSWQLGSPAPPSAPGPPQHLDPSQASSSLGPAAALGVTGTAVTASTAPLGARGTVPPEPGAGVFQGAAAGLTWGPPTHLPTMAPAPPQQPTDLPGTLGHRGGPGSPPASGDAELVQPPSSPGGWPDADTPQATPAPAAAGRAPRVFIVEDQPPLLRASLLRIPCELVLDMGFVPALQDPGSHERRGLLHSFNRTVVPLFMSVPGFLRLEVTGIREGSVVLQYDALFAAERVPAPGLGALLDAALGSGSARPGLAVGTAPVLRHVALERPLDPCALLFACRAGFTCVAGADGNATCTSLCHRDYCKNHGICTHPRDRGPLCQCPVGSDFWFVGLRCDYRVTQQSLLGVAAGVLLSIVLLGAVVAAVAIRRFKALLLEARAEQSRSSYRRFCRLDDLSARYWSRSWLPSASSLDNPAFSNSEELLHLRILDSGCCGCRGDAAATASAKQRPPARPSSHYAWDTSSSTMNDPMVDSGKASDISVSSWPLEPGQWGPFPLLHQLSRQRPHRARRPRSHGEGLELGSLERSWTA
ncbi:collagen alpha-1(I) chain-like [Tyto alba]|uniref:collagen alpha-1(I) chain-like n=1 Tax=Tyto alba TaxID=56313 RepID=UPI001C67A0C5|nr:collagen alpha-1(I) chain-like [Tyto alba]XP_042654666.1 collagen alpha-1(I) chain-like [Tyto alba]